MKITRNQEIHSAPGPEAYFTGAVRVEMQFSQQPKTKAAAAMVTLRRGPEQLGTPILLGRR